MSFSELKEVVFVTCSLYFIAKASEIESHKGNLLITVVAPYYPKFRSTVYQVNIIFIMLRFSYDYGYRSGCTYGYNIIFLILATIPFSRRLTI